jgi:hypothetical protein
MHEGGVNKLEMGVQILELFQGADLILLIKTWHFPGQQFPHVEGFDSLLIAHTMWLGRLLIIVGSLVVWQVVTHFKVIIDDTRYYVMAGDFDHMLLHLWSNIDCTFVEPQHTVGKKKFLPRFKYDKSKLKSINLP